MSWTIWWHGAVLFLLASGVYYLGKIRDLLGTIMLFMAHESSRNAVAEHFLEDHKENQRLYMKHPFTWWWHK